MKPTTSATSLPDETVENTMLKVDYSWKKWSALITEGGKEEPLYIMETRRFAAPHAVFKTIQDKQVFATGTLHYVSIHGDYEFYGRKGQLRALKRFKTAYTHLSTLFSDTDEPITMTWTSDTNFKHWDFVCVNDKQEPVARFKTNLWYVKKIGLIEFVGPKATDRAAREEILVVGVTLYYIMVLRINNVLNLGGSLFGSVGPLEAGKANGLEPQTPTNGHSEQGLDSVPLQEGIGGTRSKVD